MSWIRSRRRNSVFGSGRVTSSPRKSSWPDVARTSPTRVFAIVLLPQPLSPTSPKTSPSAMEKVTPSTAWTLASPPPRSRCTKPLKTGKYTFRSRTSRSGSVIEIDLVEMACDLPMILSHESRLRVHGLANGHPFVTSRIERASRGLAEKTRGLAGDRIEARRLQIDDRPEKALGVRVARLPEQRRGCPFLCNSTGVHDRDAVRELGDKSQVVGDEEDGHAILVHDRLQQLKDLGLQDHVEGCRWFVRD